MLDAVLLFSEREERRRERRIDRGESQWEVEGWG
jgi:hypothetical protein